jgi:hypothetical protein
VLLKKQAKFSDPLTEDVDAFTFDWSRDNNWLVPPVSLIAHNTIQ